MPSGAKKRKAAKKKREKEANNYNSSINANNPQGNDEPKSHDERESDVGEVGSPVSQEQDNHQHPFNEGNGESETGGPAPSNSFANQNKPMEGITRDAEGSLKAESDDNNAAGIENSNQNVESKDVIVEHVDSPKESHDEDDRSSCSSSSNNESQAFERKLKEVNDEEKKVGSFSEEVKQIQENGKPVKEPNSSSVLETASAVDLANPAVPISETAKFVLESAQVENPEVLEVVGSGFEETEAKLLPMSNEVVEVSPAMVVLKKNEDKVFPISDENVRASSNVAGSSVYGNVGKTLTSSDSYSAVAGNGAEKTKDTKARESTENQPLVVSAPRVAERTSWMNCCGIFDFLTGSNR